MVSIMSRFLNNLLFQYTAEEANLLFSSNGGSTQCFLSIKEVNEEGRKIKLIS